MDLETKKQIIDVIERNNELLDKKVKVTNEKNRENALNTMTIEHPEVLVKAEEIVEKIKEVNQVIEHFEKTIGTSFTSLHLLLVSEELYRIPENGYSYNDSVVDTIYDEFKKVVAKHNKTWFTSKIDSISDLRCFPKLRQEFCKKLRKVFTSFINDFKEVRRKADELKEYNVNTYLYHTTIDINNVIEKIVTSDDVLNDEYEGIYTPITVDNLMDTIEMGILGTKDIDGVDWIISRWFSEFYDLQEKCKSILSNNVLTNV